MNISLEDVARKLCPHSPAYHMANRCLNCDALVYAIRDLFKARLTRAHLEAALKFLTA